MQIGKFKPADILDAMPDWVLTRSGRQPAKPHPIARRMVDEHASLADIAKLVGSVEALKQGRPADDLRALGLGMSSSDFTAALGGSLRRVVALAYDASSPHRAFTLPVPARNFLQVDFPSVDLSDELPPVGELSELKHQVVNVSTGLSAQLYTYGGAILVTRNTIINDDVGLLDTVFTQRGAAAARTEARIIYALLESNPMLADGELMFDAGHGNIVAASLDAASLAAAMGALRTQPTLSGNLSNSKAAFLIISAALEYHAMKLLHDIGATTIDIIASPWLPADRWYLMAAPSVAPVIGRLYLEGNIGSRPTIVEVIEPKISIDGIMLRVMADFGAVPLGRLGVVRGGA
ncbi:MAG: hypothetical protein Q8L89_00975 [Gammaproteobacteria bacterium]|nr:hypothetical protein [Gammaproteobacteria bacterium]